MFLELMIEGKKVTSRNNSAFGDLPQTRKGAKKNAPLLLLLSFDLLVLNVLINNILHPLLLSTSLLWFAICNS
jgi:hypothetical protein